MEPATNDSLVKPTPSEKRVRTDGTTTDQGISTDKLNDYYSVLPELDASLSAYQTAADRLPDGLKGIFEKIGLGILPVKKEDVTATHADTISFIAQELEKRIANGEDVEPLARQLESVGNNKISAEEVKAYLTELDKNPPPKKMPADNPADHKAAPPANHVTDAFWEPLMNMPGHVGDIIKDCKPYLAEHCPSALDAIKSCYKDATGKEGWLAYATKELAAYVKRLKEERGCVPVDFERGVRTLSRLPNPQKYFGAVLEAMKKKGSLNDLTNGEHFFSSIAGRGENVIKSVFRQYAISA